MNDAPPNLLSALLHASPILLVPMIVFLLGTAWMVYQRPNRREIAGVWAGLWAVFFIACFATPVSYDRVTFAILFHAAFG